MILSRANGESASASGKFSPLRRRAARWRSNFRAKSGASSRWIARKTHRIAFGWIAAMGLLVLTKVLSLQVPVESGFDAMQVILPYILVGLAPLLGYLIGRDAFAGEYRQPATRLSVLGSWRDITPSSARESRHFGQAGLMATLLIGLLGGVGLRTIEYAITLPALNGHAPDWVHSLFLLATAELVATNFLYMVCFVMALRGTPLFPRMLLYTWLVDLALQLTLARTYAKLDLPSEAVTALESILTSSGYGVLISAAIWLPYLILSERVNVTFRHRVPSEASKA